MCVCLSTLYCKWLHHVQGTWSVGLQMSFVFTTLWPSLLPHHSVIKTGGRAMDAVTHFVNDTVEFYKWSLTIAGKNLDVSQWKQHHSKGLNLRCNSVSTSKTYIHVNCHHNSQHFLDLTTYLFSLLNSSDKRVEKWPMMSSPLPTLGFSCLYLLFLWAGPRYMQDRQPYTLRKTLIVYNFSMVVLNFYIAKEVSAQCHHMHVNVLYCFK